MGVRTESYLGCGFGNQLFPSAVPNAETGITIGTAAAAVTASIVLRESRRVGVWLLIESTVEGGVYTRSPGDQGIFEQRGQFLGAGRTR